MSDGATLHEAICDAIEAVASITRSPVPFGEAIVPDHHLNQTFWVVPVARRSGGTDGTDMADTVWEYRVVLFCRITQAPHTGVQTAMDLEQAVIAALHDDPIGGARTEVGDADYEYPDTGAHVVVSLPLFARIYTTQ